MYRQYSMQQVVPISVLLITVLGASGCGQSGSAGAPSGRDPSPPAVTVALVVERDVRDVVEDVGRTESIAQVDVRPQVSGILRSKAFEEGGNVTEGELLFEIEPAPFQADVDAQMAAVASARANAKATSKYLERLRGMREGAVSAVDMETAESDAATASANLQQAQAQLQLAQLDLAYTKITAPISGRIGQSNVDVGNLVVADGEALVTIVQLDPIYLSWSIPERLMTSVKTELQGPGSAEEINTRILPRLRLSTGVEYPHTGRVVFVDNKVDANTGTVAMRASFPNPDELLIPGQFVTVLIVRNATQSYRLIPQAAVQQDMAGYFVLVVGDDNRVEQRRVTLGSKSGTDWIVESGLQTGEQVIYQGLEKVRDGGSVAPVFDAPDVSVTTVPDDTQDGDGTGGNTQ